MFPAESPGQALVDRWSALLAVLPGFDEFELPAHLVEWRGPRGYHRTRLWKAIGAEQMSVHRFVSEDRVRESNCIAIPADGWDVPGLHLVLYEFPDRLQVVADLVPMADVLFDPGYYGRYLTDFEALVASWWPRLVAHSDVAAHPPRSRWHQQTGSCLNIHLVTGLDALDAAREFLEAAAECWVRVVCEAVPLDGGAAARATARKEQLFRGFWKTADLDSVAFPIMAEVLGDTITRSLFDVIYGPQSAWQDNNR